MADADAPADVREQTGAQGTHRGILTSATPESGQPTSAAVWCSRLSLSVVVLWVPALIWICTSSRSIAMQWEWITLILPVAALLFAISAQLVAKPSTKRRHVKIAVAVSLIAFAAGLGTAAARPRRNHSGDSYVKTKCHSNLRQIGQAIFIYAAQNNQKFPTTLDLLITVDDVDPGLFICPVSNDQPALGATTQQVVQAFKTKPGHCSYIYVGGGMNTTATAAHVIAYEPLSNHANKGAHVLYGDGSSDWLDAAAAKHLISEIQAGHNPPRPPPQSR